MHKVTQRFGGGAVIFVGDRRMIEGPQIQQLQAEQDHEFHYITAITKTQVEALLKRGVIQMSLFDETVAEVLEGDVRYVMRRNPERAKEIAGRTEVEAGQLAEDWSRPRMPIWRAIRERVSRRLNAKSKPSKRSCGYPMWSWRSPNGRSRSLPKPTPGQKPRSWMAAIV